MEKSFPKNRTFVCLDDITDYPVTMNYVIYNPMKDEPMFRVELLYRKIKENFNIELSSDELIELSHYESYELSKFVKRLKEIIQNKK